MLREISFFGLLFSPMIAFVTMAIMMTIATRFLIYNSLLERAIWKKSWINISLFSCYLALSMRTMGG